MYSRYFPFLLFLFGCLSLWVAPPVSPSESTILLKEVHENLRSHIELGRISPALENKEIYSMDSLFRFYEKRQYKALWIEDKRVKPEVKELVELIKDAENDGLNPYEYHLTALDKLINRISGNQSNQSFEQISPVILAELDILLTDAFLKLGSHYLNGRVAPETFGSGWHTQKENGDVIKSLESILKFGNLTYFMKKLAPPHKEYARLKKALKKYRAIRAQGGWPYIDPGKTLKLGLKNSQVELLRRRLHISEDLKVKHQGEDFFDTDTETAVKHFQRRHGYYPDGVVGEKTFKGLNTSVEKRIRQVELNLERWRWLPHDLGERHIRVNIAAFHLQVVEKNHIVMQMRVVVGKPYTETPVFSELMTYLVLNPSWHIPHTIAVQRILPEIKKNPSYLKKENITVLSGWNPDSFEVDATTIDWSKITAKNFTFHLKQEPGTDNTLGRIKFMFPNDYNIYLHDTPTKELFNETIRSFSAGCIRIEHPLELAEYLLSHYKNIDKFFLLERIALHKEESIHLPNPIPIHILYFTAWVDTDDIVQFRNDIYRRDITLENFLSLPQL